MYNDMLTTQTRQRRQELTTEAAEHRMRAAARSHRRSARAGHPHHADRT